MSGNVQQTEQETRLATEPQLDELRLTWERAINKLRGRLTFEVAQSWNGRSLEIDKMAEGLLSNPPALSYTVPGLCPHAKMSIIGKTDGTETLAKAKWDFSRIDPNFSNWRLDVSSLPTKRQNVSVLELERSGTLSKIFNSLSSNLDSLCLTQPQIIKFVREYPFKLIGSPHGENFFLFKSGKEFFVAHVARFGAFGSYSLGVGVHRFSDDRVLRAVDHDRIVIPTLKLKPVAA